MIDIRVSQPLAFIYQFIIYLVTVAEELRSCTTYIASPAQPPISQARYAGRDVLQPPNYRARKDDDEMVGMHGIPVGTFQITDIDRRAGDGFQPPSISIGRETARMQLSASLFSFPRAAVLSEWRFVFGTSRHDA